MGVMKRVARLGLRQPVLVHMLQDGQIWIAHACYLLTFILYGQFHQFVIVTRSC